MDKHSIKVPQLYKFASKIASKYAASEGSIKHLVYQIHHPNLKGIYSLVTTTFQHSNEIDYLIEKSQLLTKESVNPWLARILITELLWGKKRLGGESKPIKTILAYKDIFIESLNEYHNGNDANKKNNIPAPNSCLPVAKPRYVRINTLKVRTEDIITTLQNEGWKFQRKPADTYDEFLSRITNLQKDEFMFDYHVPNMLIFAKKTQFYDVAAYRENEIILQDKASCLAVHLLDPKPGSTVLDMCAAPGFKTTHIAALMENKGEVYAVDLNENRFLTMNQLIINIGAECIKTSCCDVLTITDKHCPDVEYILVDPSCSGSGITDRECINEKEDENRLEKLANFQAMILRHALTTFPKAKRVVYSTCSIHTKENEAVVQEVIQRCKEFKLVNLKTLMKDKWINFGKSEFGEIGERCLRAVSEIDHTNGFFVAMFERLKPNESNEFFVKISKVRETNHIDVACQSGKKNSKKGKNSDKSILKNKVSKSKKKKIGVQNNVDGQNDNINRNTTEKSILNDKDSKLVKKQKKKKNSIVGVQSNIENQNDKININKDENNKNFVFSNKSKEKSSLNNQGSKSVTSKNKMKKKKKNSIGIQNEDNESSVQGTDNKLEKNTNSDGRSDTNTSSKEIKRKTIKSTNGEDESVKKRKTIEEIKGNTEITGNNENIKITKKRKTNKTCETIEEAENKGNEEEIEESNDEDQSHWVFYNDDDDDDFDFIEQRAMFLT